MGLDERPLHELGSMASQEAKVEAYRRLLLQGMARDYKPAWPGMRFKELFGYWPLPSVRQAAEELVKGVTHVRYDSTV
jgi:hypothetical protein